MLLLALACIENGLNEPGQEIEEPLRELVVAPAGLDFGEVELGACAQGGDERGFLGVPLFLLFITIFGLGIGRCAEMLLQAVEVHLFLNRLNGLAHGGGVRAVVVAVHREQEL